MKRKEKKNNTHGVEIITKPSIPVTDGAKIYTQLRTQVIQAGILKRQYGYYAMLVSTLTLGLILTLILYALTTNILVLILLSILTGIFIVQFGGLMHDAGHQAVFHSQKFNDMLGHFSAIVSVISYDLWKDTHNKHHAHPNEEDEDPDIGLPFHAFNEKQLMTGSKVERMLSRYQAFLFYPMRAFTFVSSRLGSWQFLRTNKEKYQTATVFFIIGIICWYILPFLAYGIPKALLFLFISNLVGGIYASNVFAPNHKGMPLIAKGVKMSFFEQQIVTARNVHAHPLVGFFYMGLHYQIEHHLFPNCPRNNIARLAHYVRHTCHQYGLPYISDSVYGTHKDIVTKLNTVGKTLS